MRRLNSLLQTDFITEQCDDPINKTHFAYMPLDNFVCFAVAESYDNDVDIDSAKLAVEAVLTSFERRPSLKKIKEYIGYAHEQLVINSVKNQLKASVTVMVSDYTRMRYGVCGNTKLHIFYHDMFILRSKTQTFHQNVLDNDEFQKLDGREIRNVLEFLGKEKKPKPYISKKLNLTENSTIVFSTCNLWEKISDIEMLDAYEDSKDNVEFLDNLQELFLSDQDESKVGSYSVLAVFIDKTFKEDTSKKKKLKRILKNILIVLLILGLISSITVLFIRRNDRAAMEEINRIDREGVRFSAFGNHARALEQYRRALALVERLNMNNRQYRVFKYELNNRIREREAIFTAISDGELLIESQNYTDALTAFQFVARGASVDTELGLMPMATEQLRRINQAREILSLISIEKMHDVSSEYAGALIAYQQALGLARLSYDIDTQRDIQLRILDINQRIQAREELEIAIALGDEEAAQQEAINKQLAQIEALTIAALQAEGIGDNLSALEYFEEVLALYEQMNNVDVQLRTTHERIIALNKAIAGEELALAEQEVLSQVQEYLENAVSARREEDYEAAIEYYELIIELYREIDAPTSQIERMFDEILRLEEVIREELQRQEMLEQEMLEQEERLQAELEEERQRQELEAQLAELQAEENELRSEQRATYLGEQNTEIHLQEFEEQELTIRTEEIELQSENMYSQ